MKGAGMILTVLVGLGIGYYVYSTQFKALEETTGTASPKAMIDITGIRMDLNAIAQAQRMYLASKGSYATLDQLQQSGNITFSGQNRRGYNFRAEVNGGRGFRVIATPADPSLAGAPTFSVDQTMWVTQH